MGKYGPEKLRNSKYFETKPLENRFARSEVNPFKLTREMYIPPLTFSDGIFFKTPESIWIFELKFNFLRIPFPQKQFEGKMSYLHLPLMRK